MEIKIPKERFNLWFKNDTIEKHECTILLKMLAEKLGKQVTLERKLEGQEIIYFLKEVKDESR